MLKIYGTWSDLNYILKSDLNKRLKFLSCVKFGLWYFELYDTPVKFQYKTDFNYDIYP